jgi:hypothetical protein
METTLPPYSLVPSSELTDEHKLHIDELKRNISFISFQTNVIFGAKYIDSWHIISTDAYAKLVGLNTGEEVENRFDRDMPCEGTAELADQFVREDHNLITNPDINKKVSILNVHNYSDGLRAMVFEKSILKHKPTKSILGLLYSAYEIELNSFLTLIPNYIVEFGLGNMESTDDGIEIDNIRLSEKDHEICFLLTMRWNFQQISDFLNKYSPHKTPTTANTIYETHTHICERLCLPNNSAAVLREKLVSMGVHTKIPQTFFNRLVRLKPTH